ncbi:hypothetical protein NDU88_000880 [Pleurodeles waltl]|uniref:Uncharacterized protein n=1 Tax=Pleurodeles waltl TaxID=8319 RepID=A0AAV7LB51_PLEWA|nr:hypothetical protein NDU88_000880 [Pleurodeles waltl]
MGRSRYPEAPAGVANPRQLPEHSGLHSASGDGFWRPGQTEEEESPKAEENNDIQRNLFWTADNSCECSHRKQPTRDDAGLIFVTRGPENQEGGGTNTPATL